MLYIYFFLDRMVKSVSTQSVHVAKSECFEWKNVLVQLTSSYPRLRD